MYDKMKIAGVEGMQILDSRGNPTVRAKVVLCSGTKGVASVPSGASTGLFEALELRDGEKNFDGKGVEKAVAHINGEIREALLGMDADRQWQIDGKMREVDGTEEKSKLGANAILGVSLAAARAAAKERGEELYQYIGGVCARKMPIPMMNILNGGRHAANTIDFQEFMIMPVGFEKMCDRIRVCTEIYHCLATLLKEDGMDTAVGDEGGFAPNLKDTQEALSYLEKAVKKAGYAWGSEIAIALDVAASEFYEEETGKYYFAGETAMRGERVERTSEEMIDYLEMLCDRYPIISIEDGLQEEDWDGWTMLTKRLGNRVALVGDDLFVTNTKRLHKGIMMRAGNAILIKVNQIGSLSEAIEAIWMAKEAGYGVIISHRSGETTDSFIADLAVGVNAGQIKTGAPCRSERTEKYNRLLEIEKELDQIEN